MKKIILLIFTGFITTLSFGQADLKPQFDKARNYLKNNEFENAIKEFTSVLINATDWKVKKFAFIYRGFAKNGLNSFDSAIVDFDNALRIDPNDLGTYIDRGQAKIYANRIDDAVKDFQFVLSNDSLEKQGQNALFYLANIAHKRGQFELSIGYYDKLIALAPTDAEAYFNRGCAKDMMMDSQGSIKDYDKAIEYNPKYKEAYANRGVAKINSQRTKGNILLTKDQTKDACADLKMAKQLGDNSVDDMILIHCNK